MKNGADEPDAQLKKELHKIGEEFPLGVIEEGIRVGAIDAKHSDHIGITTYLMKHMKGRRRSRTPFFTVIDHRESILREARLFAKYHKPELALLLYATWIEHFVNSLIEGAARKTQLPVSQIADLIRDTPLKGKVSWLLYLLGLPSMPPSRQKVIEQIRHVRNGFVHYKWNFKNIDDHSEDERLEKIIRPTESLVSYLKRYERRYVLHYSRKQLKIILDKGMLELHKNPSAVRH